VQREQLQLGLAHARQVREDGGEKVDARAREKVDDHLPKETSGPHQTSSPRTRRLYCEVRRAARGVRRGAVEKCRIYQIFNVYPSQDLERIFC
jgi:hypothetical protein